MFHIEQYMQYIGECNSYACCTDGVQLTLQNLGGHLEMLCRRLATCILQQCRGRRGRILLQ